MSQDLHFPEFLRRIRAGDPQATEELVRLYETPVRVVIRARLTDPKLRQRFDSVDVCQSVFASFFFRVAAGQYDLREPRDLGALLARMAQNKLSHQRRYHQQEQRDVRRTEHADSQGLELRKESPDPAKVVAWRDLFERARAQMTAEERLLADRRAAGCSWDEIAQERGVTAATLRKQYSRTLARLAPLLGLDDDEPLE